LISLLGTGDIWRAIYLLSIYFRIRQAHEKYEFFKLFHISYIKEQEIVANSTDGKPTLESGSDIFSFLDEIYNDYSEKGCGNTGVPICLDEFELFTRE
jgi:hypothetical protein